jgi:hypothetical protein
MDSLSKMDTVLSSLAKAAFPDRFLKKLWVKELDIDFSQ